MSRAQPVRIRNFQVVMWKFRSEAKQGRSTSGISMVSPESLRPMYRICTIFHWICAKLAHSVVARAARGAAYRSDRSGPTIAGQI